jgi:hypothetical protein
MRIIEILSATSDQEINVDDPHSLPIRIGDQHLMQRIANAFTRGGVLKRLWDFDNIEQPPDEEPSARTATSKPHPAISVVPPPSLVPGASAFLAAPLDGHRDPFPEPRRLPIRR